jgi:hypothetical protein
MFFFSYLSSVTLADSEKNRRVSHFTTNPFDIDTTTPGERQKLITFPLTAEKCHLLIFSSSAVRRQRGQERKQGKIKYHEAQLRLRDE